MEQNTNASMRPGEAHVEVTSEGKETNRTNLQCPRCGSLLLLPGKGTLCQRRITLHKSRTTSGQQSEEEVIEWHWEVESMFEFENMGFSNTLQGERPAKYLTCADCEQDVLGIHYLDEQRMYLATSRVSAPSPSP